MTDKLAEELRKRAADAQQKLAALERFPADDPYEMGTIIRWGIQPGQPAYTVSIKTPAGWKHSGMSHGSYQTWEGWRAAYLINTTSFEVLESERFLPTSVKPAVVIEGNPVDGFQFIGPFRCGEDAQTWGEVHRRPTPDWYIADMERPVTDGDGEFS